MAMLSLIVPVCNEEEILPDFHSALAKSIRELPLPTEIIYVNDGSTDRSAEILQCIKQMEPAMRTIHLQERCGQASAMQAGFDHAHGDIIATLDADLEVDPAALPVLFSKFQQGYDAVFGCRTKRPARLKHFLSALGNSVFRLVFQTPVRDMACPLKVMKKELLSSLVLRQNRHRYLPILFHFLGARLAEVEVVYNPRRFGRSKFRQLHRIWEVARDLVVLLFCRQIFLDNTRRDYRISFIC